MTNVSYIGHQVTRPRTTSQDRNKKLYFTLPTLNKPLDSLLDLGLRVKIQGRLLTPTKIICRNQITYRTSSINNLFFSVIILVRVKSCVWILTLRLNPAVSQSSYFGPVGGNNFFYFPLVTWFPI
jgi:hypothetical protein